MDEYDIAEDHGGSLARAFAASKARFCLISFDTDWLYPTAESRLIVHALNAGGAQASFVELSSPFGPDAFLLECPELNRGVDGFQTGGRARAGERAVGNGGSMTGQNRGGACN